MSRKSVALLIETSNGYCRGLLEGVISYMKERGNWSVHIQQTYTDKPPAWLNSWNADGIIARIYTDHYGQQLLKLGIPTVDLNAARHVKGIPCADIDDEAIAKLAFNHFTERGFKNLAFCGDSQFAWSLRRCQQFRELANKEGRQFFEYQSSVGHGEIPDLTAEKKCLSEWITQLPQPIAIMASHDARAQQILDVCGELRLSVPEKIAVLGVDDDRLICELCEPTLSSVIPDTKRTGYEAAELLDKMMDGSSAIMKKPFLTKPLGIRQRESTNTLAVEDKDIAQALHFIRNHALENIRVNDVLSVISLSRRTFEHRFKTWVGCTPHEEIQRVRMNRVKTFLTETSLSVQEIAKRTGFEHAEYLAAAFRRENGLTPSEFRSRESNYS